MKKLVHSALSLCLVMALAVLGACASPTEDGATKEDGVTKESSSSTPEFAAWQNEKPFHGLDLAEYITLGAYKGITVYATRAETVETGDLAIFDFEGTAPGLSKETLAGMKAERYDQLYVGSGNFIPGFEEQMIGKKIGEAFKVNVTFPEDYAPEGEPQEELNGKEVTFQCVVHELRGKVASLATQAAYEKIKLINLPEGETEMLRLLLDLEAASYDMSKEEYLQAIGGQEQWTAGIEEQLKQEMFIYAIAQKEGLEAAEKDMQTYFNNIRKSQGDESIKDEDIIAQHYCKNLLMRDLTKEKVIAFIGEQAKLS